MNSAPDQSIIERDPVLRGLPVLLDADLLTACLNDATDQTGGQEAKINYLRYKPGVNCIARFTYGDRMGYAKAYGPNASNKIAKAVQGTSSCDGSATAMELPGKDVVCRFFPQDAELPALANLDNEPGRKRLFERVFKMDPTWRNATIAILNYKPERRFVACVQHVDGRRATLKLLGKREFAATRRSRKKFNLPHGLQLPDWIGGSKGLRALVFDWLPGQVLEQRLCQGHCKQVGDAGEAIARLHASEQPALGKRSSKSRGEVLASLARQMAHLVPALAADAARLANHLQNWFAQQDQVRRPIHGDFYARQVVVGNDSIGIIDMDGAQLGPPQDDLGCFIAHLERRQVQGQIDTHLRDRAQVALLEGYAAAADQAANAGLDHYIAYHLFKLSPHPFRDRDPDWHQQITRLLDRCQALTGMK